MSYYNPNLYNSNNMGQPYNNFGNNNNNNYNIPSPQPMPQMSQVTQQIPQNVLNTLNGKIVDSEDIVKATEVPIGSYGVFPKADLSEIYIKTWNNNGTTRIIKYQPIMPAQQEENNAPEIKNDDTIDKILEKIEQLENKLDDIISGNNKAATKKEVNISAY